MKKLYKAVAIAFGSILFLVAVALALVADAIDSAVGYCVGAYCETKEVCGMYSEAVTSYWNNV